MVRLFLQTLETILWKVDKSMKRVFQRVRYRSISIWHSSLQSNLLVLIIAHLDQEDENRDY